MCDGGGAAHPAEHGGCTRRFPRIKRLADFDLTATAGINAATIATLASGAYLDAGEPVVLLGDGARASHTC